jgi:small-conductance mechanosensitive channel
VEGEIVEIDLRYTVLEATPGSTRVLVPKSTLFTNTITVTARPAPPTA